MGADFDPEDAHHRLAARYRRLAAARKKSLTAGVVARFTEIDGGTQAVVVSVQLFTTVIPLIIIGFDFLSGFAESASPGALIIRELGLVSRSANGFARLSATPLPSGPVGRSSALPAS